jgi:Dyp-type peroxidase family
VKRRLARGCETFEPGGVDMSGESRRTVAEDVTDIQGIILRGYKPLWSARFVSLRIPDRTSAQRAKAWVGRVAGRVRYGGDELSTPSLNVAFTYSGLERLGLGKLTDAAALSVTKQFAGPFELGMTTEYRRRILGDTTVNGSAPEGWEWGGPTTRVDALLLLYAVTPDELTALSAREIADAEAGGLEVVHSAESRVPPGETEEFGFHDGIANPRIKGLTDSEAAIEPGEFLLGYLNEYHVYAARPRIRPGDDPSRILPLDEEETGAGDFGRNGSYLVVRQLKQDAFAFWSAIDERCAGNVAERELLAAKMVGRWRSGAPLVKTWNADDPRLAFDDDFTYQRDDPHGLRCPIGAHIRRTNPRDALDPDPGTQRSVDINKRHRIIRRGRPYGPPVTEPIDPQRIIDAGPGYDDADRGIFFMCFNANITRQFEFIQESWLNNRKFAGLNADTDPLMGDRAGESSTTASFTIPSEPVRRRVTGLPQFVHVRGGAYFFMPGGRALRFLSLLPD